jgi:Tfp pilus assembly protein PilF
MGRDDAGEAQLQKAIALDPNFGPSYASLGLLRVHQGKNDEALRFLTRAVQADLTNYMAHYYYAYMLQVADSRDTNSSGGQKLQLMREHLRKTVELAPDYSPAYDMLGYVALVSREDLPQTEELLRKALMAAPGKRLLRLRLAELMIANNEPAAARVILSPLKNVSDDESVQRRTESLLNDIQRRIESATALREYNDRQRAATEARAQAAAAIRDSVPDATPEGPPKIRRSETSTPTNETKDETSAPPILRPDGKQVEGSLVSIDCNQGMTLRLRAGNGILQFHSDDAAKIEFVSYTTAVSGSFSCGQFKNEPHVLIVYKTGDDPRFVGEPLRVEFTANK